MTRNEGMKEFLKEVGNVIGANVQQVEQYFDYLDDLRDSGVTNMYGATPYLQREFDFNKQDARTVLKAWMESYGM